MKGFLPQSGGAIFCLRDGKAQSGNKAGTTCFRSFLTQGNKNLELVAQLLDEMIGPVQCDKLTGTCPSLILRWRVFLPSEY